MLDITDAYAAISARTSSIPTRIYLLRGPSDRIFNAAICEFLVVLFVIMIGIVEIIEKRIQNKIVRKPKKPKKIFKTEVPLIKSVQEFKKLRKNSYKRRLLDFFGKYLYRLKEFFRKKKLRNEIFKKKLILWHIRLCFRQNLNPYF